MKRNEKDTKAQQGDYVVNEQQKKVAILWANILLCFMDIQFSFMITENFKWRKMILSFGFEVRQLRFPQ